MDIPHGGASSLEALPLSPLGEACSRMDLTAIHEILEKIGYKDDEGTTNEVGIQDFHFHFPVIYVNAFAYKINVFWFAFMLPFTCKYLYVFMQIIVSLLAAMISKKREWEQMMILYLLMLLQDLTCYERDGMVPETRILRPFPPKIASSLLSEIQRTGCKSSATCLITLISVSTPFYVIL